MPFVLNLYVADGSLVMGFQVTDAMSCGAIVLAYFIYMAGHLLFLPALWKRCHAPAMEDDVDQDISDMESAG